MAKGNYLYLGHVISADGISVAKDRKQSVVDLPKPQSRKELHSVVDVANFVHRLVEDYAEGIAPRKDYALKHRFKKAWGEEQHEAFDCITRVLQSAPELHS